MRHPTSPPELFLLHLQPGLMAKQNRLENRKDTRLAVHAEMEGRRQRRPDIGWIGQDVTMAAAVW